jgi:hypothetical protein
MELVISWEWKRNAYYDEILNVGEGVWNGDGNIRPPLGLTGNRPSHRKSPGSGSRSLKP